MIQLQNYINSSFNLEHKQLTLMRKNMLLLQPRKFFKGLQQSKSKAEPQPRYKQEITSKEEFQVVNHAKNRYEKLMKVIREPIKMEFNRHRYSLEKQKKEVANFIRFKSHWKPRLQTELHVERYRSSQAEQEQENDDRQQISKTTIPNKSEEQNEQKRKFSIKTEASEYKNSHISSYIKPKTTILKRILDAKHIKHVRQIVNSSTEKSMQNKVCEHRNNFESQCSAEALEQIRRQYEYKPIKKQRQNKKFGKLSKLAKLKNNSGQNIAGWTIKQIAD